MSRNCGCICEHKNIISSIAVIETTWAIDVRNALDEARNMLELRINTKVLLVSETLNLKYEVVFGHATETADVALIPFPSVQKTCEALESKLVPPQETTTLTETPYKRSDRVAAVPVVGSFFVWKICEALDLPATFVPEERVTTVSRKQFHVNQPVPVVYSVAVFKMCQALQLKAQLAQQ
ncbi:hypothetical protein NPIL_81031 [Nephila pilipes]|uniref:Uncharacterized protein n=1 Tax=Nephila pilipes TaxID=299642 RepID=A0A8X6MIS6_NEPPI|nr:hypothetical protein NPIL_292831 [Nephila pilipes]GFT36904.1 hypothetical protein NPIL_81031 [Nephila pilipes]